MMSRPEIADNSSVAMLSRPSVGIDLGTSTSSIAILDAEGVPHLVPDAAGDRNVPSVVLVGDDGELRVGREARERAHVDPDAVAVEIKRMMGTGETLRLGRKVLFPEEIAAAILRHLRAAATAGLGRDFEDVVISVPARFENAAREATRKAATLAGLHTLRLVNEPTAAALAYGREHLDERARILVFDFGGGTLDVTVLEMFEGILDVRTSVGDDRLGGKDIDDLLAGHLRERFRAAHGRRLPPPSKDRALARRLKAEAERIKIALSERESVAIELPDCDGGDALEGEILRESLEAMLEETLMRAMATVNDALARARLRWDDIDVVLPVGGTSRIPLFRRALEFASGKDLARTRLDPEEAVALGAAVAAGIELDHVRKEASELMVLDVSPHRLGIATIKRVGDQQFVEDYFSELVPKDAKLPAINRREYQTLSDGDGPIGIRIYEAAGETNLCRDHRLIAEMNLRALASDARNEAVRVEFRYTLDGTLEVGAGYVSAPMVRVEGAFAVEGAADDVWRAKPLAPSAEPLVEQAERAAASARDTSAVLREAIELVKLAVLRDDEDELRRRMDTLTDLVIENA
ncbi:MAG: Hsp70 family protein [Armatimonadota bacterium]